MAEKKEIYRHKEAYIYMHIDIYLCCEDKRRRVKTQQGLVKVNLENLLHAGKG